MRESLFRYYVEIGHELCYQKAFATSARRIDNAYSGFLLLASAACIATLSFWNELPWLWALITLAAQILQILKPLMPFSKQSNALRFIIQDTQALFDEVAFYWDTVGAYAETSTDQEDIDSEVLKFKRRQQAIIDRFAPNIDFPLKKRLAKKAGKENQKYFQYHYSVGVRK